MHGRHPPGRTAPRRGTARFRDLHRGGRVRRPGAGAPAARPREPADHRPAGGPRGARRGRARRDAVFRGRAGARRLDALPGLRRGRAGRLRRRRHRPANPHDERVRRRLDAEADALGLAAASGIAVLASGTLPAWYLLAGFGRYLFGAALFVEERLGRRLRALPPSPFRRRLAGFQMGLVAVCLAPFIEPQWAPPATAALGAPFLLGFARDYLISTGRIDPESAGAAPARRAPRDAARAGQPLGRRSGRGARNPETGGVLHGIMGTRGLLLRLAGSPRPRGSSGPDVRIGEIPVWMTKALLRR